MNLISWKGKERKNEKKGYKEKELNYVYIDNVIIKCFIGSKWEKNAWKKDLQGKYLVWSYDH